MQNAAGDNRKMQGVAYKDKTKPNDIRNSNINAAKGNFLLSYIMTLTVIYFVTRYFTNLTLLYNVLLQVVQEQGKKIFLYCITSPNVFNL